MVAVDYYQAPEHKFPAAPNDAYAAYTWTVEHSKEINGDLARVAVGGESAGGRCRAVRRRCAEKGVCREGKIGQGRKPFRL